MSEKKHPILNVTAGADPSDPDPRCGSGIASLPADDPFSQACAAHDAEYLYNAQGRAKMTREQADRRLRAGLDLVALNERYNERGTGFDRLWERGRAKVLGYIGSVFGRLFW